MTTRLNTIFLLKRRSVFTRNETTNNKKRVMKQHFCYIHHSPFTMACNIVKFLLCCQRGVHRSTAESKERISYWQDSVVVPPKVKGYDSEVELQESRATIEF